MSCAGIVEKLQEQGFTVSTPVVGQLLKKYDLMARTKMTAGLKVFSQILTGNFETGHKVTDGFKENMRIQFDDYLPQWNYFANPKTDNVLEVN